MTEKIIKTEEVAEMLSVSVHTVKKWRQKEQGPPFRRIEKRMIRYRESEVWNWLREHCNQRPA